MLEKQDIHPPIEVIPSNADIPAANTELVIWDSTRVHVVGTADQDLVTYALRQFTTYLKRAWLTVYADQPLTFFHRHLAVKAAADETKWRNVPDGAGSIVGTVLPAAELAVINAHFFGDDHRLILKTGATPPTFWEISLRFSLDQSVAE